MSLIYVNQNIDFPILLGFNDVNFKPKVSLDGKVFLYIHQPNIRSGHSKISHLKEAKYFTEIANIVDICGFNLVFKLHPYENR